MGRRPAPDGVVPHSPSTGPLRPGIRSFAVGFRKSVYALIVVEGGWNGGVELVGVGSAEPHSHLGLRPLKRQPNGVKVVRPLGLPYPSPGRGSTTYGRGIGEGNSMSHCTLNSATLNRETGDF